MTEDAKPLSGAPWLNEGPAPYANHLEIVAGISEIELRFAQDFGPGGALVTQCRVLTSPVHLLGFGQAISGAVVNYEERFGRIPESVSRSPKGERH